VQAGRTLRTGIAIAATIWLLTGVIACSSESEDTLDFGTTVPPRTSSAAALATPVASTVVATSLLPSATSTSGATTTAPTSTSTTIATTTTVAAGTTTTAVSADEALTAAAVERDFRAAAATRLGCNYQPAECDFAGVAVPGSPTDTSLRETISQWVATNRRAVPGQGDYQFEIEKVDVSPPDRAYVTMCGYDTLVVFDVGDPSTPDDDVVVDDSQPSFRVFWEMRLVEGRWKNFQATTLAEQEGPGLCTFGE
jgi:hypothetical protein